MQLNQRIRISIDNLTYTEMLSKVRFAPLGSELFIGESGEYFAKVMAEKRKLITDAEHTTASKQIGWGE